MPIRDDYIYLAGLIDADGCIDSKKNRDIKWKRQIRVRVGITDKGITDWLKDTFGGSVCVKVRPNPKHKDVYTWTLGCHKAELLLTELVKYLRIKKEQAEYTLKIRQLDVKDVVGLEQCYEKISQLKRKTY